MEDLKGIAPWLVAVLGVLWAIIKTLGSREVQRYDLDHERISKMERENVTREELNEILDRREEERRRMHQENGDRLKRIEDKLDGLGHLTVRVAILERETGAR